MTEKTPENEPDNSLREEFGLPPITSEPNSPPVDRELIDKLLNDQPITDQEHEFLMDAIGRFAPWRRVYDEMVVQQFAQRNNHDF